jgi:hypothetical protein
VRGQLHTPGRLTPGEKDPGYPLDRRPSGPQGLCGHCREKKISCSFYNLTQLPRSSRPQPSHYTNWTISNFSRPDIPTIPSRFEGRCGILSSGMRHRVVWYKFTGVLEDYTKKVAVFLDLTTDDTYQSKKFWEKLIAYSSWYNTDRIENDVSNNSSIVARVLLAAETFLQSRCLVTIEEYIYRHIDWWEGFMNYAVKMGSVAMTCQVSYILVRTFKI